jgi:hypothetical protein
MAQLDTILTGRSARRIDETSAMTLYGAVGLSLRQSLGRVIFRVESKG